jgi:hypothetical protein
MSDFLIGNVKIERVINSRKSKHRKYEYIKEKVIIIFKKFVKSA